MKDKEIKTLWEEISEAREQGDHYGLKELLERSLSLSSDEVNLKDWYKFRIRLAGLLLDEETEESLQRAIELLKDILSKVSKDINSKGWATAHLGLGCTYDKLASITGEDYIRKIIHHYQKALEVYALESYPEDWAMVTAGLGAAWYTRSKGNRKLNYENALSLCKAALDVYTPEDYPEDHEDVLELIAAIEEDLEKLEE